MKTRTLLILLPLLCWFAEPLLAAEPIDVSLVQLLANPKDYDGKVVTLTGFMRLEFEGDGIYLHEDDFRHSIYKNGLWLDVTEDMQKRREELDQKYVLVEGTFDAKDTGHMGLWSGSLRKITRCQVIETRKTSANNPPDPFAQIGNEREEFPAIKIPHPFKALKERNMTVRGNAPGTSQKPISPFPAWPGERSEYLSFRASQDCEALAKEQV